MSNYNTKYYYKFPVILTLLQYKDGNNKNKYIRFNSRAKLYGCYNPNRDIIIQSTGIGRKMIDTGVDKLIKIEYIRNEKSWKKYYRYNFLHWQDQTEKVIVKNPNEIRIKGLNKLWGFQKIQDEEVE